MASAQLSNPALQDAEKITVYAKDADFFPAGAGEAVATASVKDGAAEVKDLKDGVPYWAQTDKGEHFAFTGKEPAENAKEPKAEKQISAELAKSRPELPDDEAQARAQVGEDRWKALHEKPREEHPQPAISQTHYEGKPQRSDTPLGTATPVDPDEQQPFPDQHSVKDGVAQRSDTPEGEATPTDPEEIQPFERQEDEDREQMSDTDTGQATPVEEEDPEKQASDPVKAVKGEIKRHKAAKKDEKKDERPAAAKDAKADSQAAQDKPAARQTLRRGR